MCNMMGLMEPISTTLKPSYGPNPDSKIHYWTSVAKISFTSKFICIIYVSENS